jgi:hypothetical protein
VNNGAHQPAPPGSAWRSARRELAVAACLALALTLAAWALDGPAAAGLALLICAALGLLVLRGVVTRAEPDPPVLVPEGDAPAGSFLGFWRMQADLADATRSLSAWDHGTRPRLLNLFAARLSEHHQVSLADDPQEARRLLLSRPSRHDLWYWIDPSRPTPDDAASRPGIPLGVLAALIDRLEQL